MLQALDPPSIHMAGLALCLVAGPAPSLATTQVHPL